MKKFQEKDEAVDQVMDDTEREQPQRHDAQDSLGVLADQGDPSKFRNLGWTTELLEIGELSHFDLIPDFARPTEADRPIVVRTPSGCFCLDGWDLVAEEKSKGKTSILVDVDHMPEHSCEELCLRKMVLRIATRGEVTYAEIIRNTREIFAKLLASNEDLKVFSHGGRRDRAALSGNREEDAVEIIARRIRKDRDTVQKHLQHATLLSDAAIESFIKDGAPKRFFEKMQTQKRRLENRLKAEEKSYCEMAEAVSNFMITAFADFIEKKKQRVEKTSGTASDHVQNKNEPLISAEDEPECSTSEDEEDLEEPVEEESEECGGEEPITMEAIRNATRDISRRLEERISKNPPLEEIEHGLREEMQRIGRILSQIAHLKNLTKK